MDSTLRNLNVCFKILKPRYSRTPLIQPRHIRLLRINDLVNFEYVHWKQCAAQLLPPLGSWSRQIRRSLYFSACNSPLGTSRGRQAIAFYSLQFSTRHTPRLAGFNCVCNRRHENALRDLYLRSSLHVIRRSAHVTTGGLGLLSGQTALAN